MNSQRLLVLSNGKIIDQKFAKVVNRSKYPITNFGLGSACSVLSNNFLTPTTRKLRQTLPGIQFIPSVLQCAVPDSDYNKLTAEELSGTKPLPEPKPEMFWNSKTHNQKGSGTTEFEMPIPSTSSAQDQLGYGCSNTEMPLSNNPEPVASNIDENDCRSSPKETISTPLPEIEGDLDKTPIINELTPAKDDTKEDEPNKVQKNKKKKRSNEINEEDASESEPKRLKSDVTEQKGSGQVIDFENMFLIVD